MRKLHLLLSTLLICVVSACGGSSNNNSGFQASSQMTSASSMSSLSSTSSSVILSSSASSSSRISSSSSSEALLLSYGSNSMQVGQLRLPRVQNNEPVPLVIIIHGGCWVSSIASYHFMDNFSQSITSLGYATWNIEYRALGTGGDWPVIFQDVSKAVDYSRSLAQNYPININKVAVIGHSAGGHLALWVASRKNLNSTSLAFTDNPLVINGVISLAGIANVTGYNTCGTLANDVIGVPIAPSSSNLTQRLVETSPLQMLPTGVKTILISGNTDSIVPPPMGTEYSAEAVKQGDDSEHHILQGRGHFELIDSTKTDWTLYQESLKEFFKD